MIENPAQKSAYYTAVVSLLMLIALCIAWETILAPLRPGGSWMVLKVVPLLLPLRGILKRDIYTLQWSSMLILLYLMEGLVRGASDRGLSATLGWVEVALVVIFFIATLMFLKPYKKAAKQIAKAAIEKASHTLDKQ